MPDQTLTTGEVAKFCGVNFRTVIRWIKRGHLCAYQLPGRGDNRIYIQDFLQFLAENNLPIPTELQQHTQRVLICITNVDQANALISALKDSGYDARIANDGVLAGAQLEAFSPSIVAIDFNDFGHDGKEIVAHIRNHDHLRNIRLLALGDAPLPHDIDAVLSKPFNPSKFIASIINLKEAA